MSDMTLFLRSLDGALGPESRVITKNDYLMFNGFRLNFHGLAQSRVFIMLK